MMCVTLVTSSLLSQTIFTLPKKYTRPVEQVNGNLHLPLSNFHAYNTRGQVDFSSSDQF